MFRPSVLRPRHSQFLETTRTLELKPPQRSFTREARSSESRTKPTTTSGFFGAVLSFIDRCIVGKVKCFYGYPQPRKSAGSFAGVRRNFETRRPSFSARKSPTRPWATCGKGAEFPRINSRMFAQYWFQWRVDPREEIPSISRSSVRAGTSKPPRANSVRD